MRVATFVLGIALALSGGASEASDAANGPSKGVRVSLAQGALVTPASDRFIPQEANSWVGAHEGNLRNGASGAMGFVPSQNPASTRSRLTFGEPATQAARPYNPANIPLPATRTFEDHLLTGFVALMLIAYQLRRKHRFLRPHQFST